MADFVSAVWSEISNTILTVRHIGVLRLSYTTHATSGNGTSESTYNIYGQLLQAETNPTDTHTASWDLSVLDEAGATLLSNTAVHASNSEIHAFSKVGTYQDPWIVGKPTVTIEAAGNSKSGVVDIYYRW